MIRSHKHTIVFLHVFFFATLLEITAQTQIAKPVNFREFLESRLASSSTNGNRIRLADVCPIDSDPIAMRVFKGYGAMFAASDSVIIPPKCILSSEAEVAAFQKGLSTKTSMINGFTIELQEAAMNGLLKAVEEAQARGLRITPLDGSIAGKRNFADTVRIWNSRFLPALNYWVSRKKITRTDADATRKMNLPDQIKQVMEWESKGFYFSTGKNQTIFVSVAPPGTSQHLSMLAFDIEQAGNSRVRAILNRHGWFQTVANDDPHFTYLGLPEAELPRRGLISVVKNGYKFWIPKLN